MLSSAQVKYLSALHQKKYRQMYGDFLIEGAKLLTEVLRTDWKVKQIVHNADFEIDKLDIPEGISVEIAKPADMKRISSLKHSPGILALVEQKQQSPNLSANQVLCLDGINDPGNLGTIIRTADWLGIREVWCSPNCADIYNPKVVQATMGSLFKVRLSIADLPELLKEYSYPVYCATLGGKKLGTHKIPLDAALVIGSESHGISSDVLNCCNEEITIPAGSTSDSLNAGVAAAILLWEWNRPINS